MKNIIPNNTEVLIFNSHMDFDSQLDATLIEGRIISSYESDDLSQHGSPWTEQIYSVQGEDGKIYKGKFMETHTQLVERVFLKQKPNNNDKDIQRIDNDTMEKDVGSDIFAFGHIAMNMAFIDDNLSNCTREEVADALKSQTNVNKVYYYDYSDKQVTRLAKLKSV